MRRVAPQLFAQLLFITLLSVSVSNAQTTAAQKPTSRDSMQNRGWVRGSLTNEFNSEIARQKQLTQASLKNDFRKLQIVNNQLMVRMFVPPSGSSKKITKKEIKSSLGEIKKLAERLRDNLPIPKVEPVEQTDQLELAPGLLLLDKALMQFVHNPLFQQPRVFDAELALQAAGDLNEVLRLAKILRELSKE